MSELSPAAQAVLDAYRDADIADEVTAAAVLRAAVDQILPKEPEPRWYEPVRPRFNRQCIRRRFLAIASELENL